MKGYTVFTLTTAGYTPSVQLLTPPDCSTDTPHYLHICLFSNKAKYEATLTPSLTLMLGLLDMTNESRFYAFVTNSDFSHEFILYGQGIGLGELY